MKSFFLTLGCFLVSFSANAALPITHHAMPAAELQSILDLFPERQEVTPSLLDFNVDPNIHLFQDANIIITFLHEGAALRNSFGYFLYRDENRDGDIEPAEISDRQVIFDDVSDAASGGSLLTGDSVNLGKFAKGTNLGFFLSAKQGDQSWTFYTLDGLNHDGRRHLAMVVAPDGESVALGIEDLPWSQSDRDFNDILFSFTTDPKSALDEVIDAGNIPGASPEPTAPPCVAKQIPESIAQPNVPETDHIAVDQSAHPFIPTPMLEGGGRGCSLTEASDPNAGGGFAFWALASLVSAIPMARAPRNGSLC